jgi:hypothetical protein
VIAMFVGLAMAGGVHAGIPVHGVAGVGAPTFLTPNSGWTAAAPGGWVRVFVGAIEAEGAAWYAHQLETMTVPAPDFVLPGVDAAAGDGDTFVAWQDGNVGVVVRVESGAGALATRLRASVVEQAPAVTARWRAGADVWVDAPGAAAMRSTSGGVILSDSAEFRRKPAEVYVWDAWGRVTVLR